MARAKGIEGELAAVSEALEVHDRDIAQAAQDIAAAARARTILDAVGEVPALQRFAAIGGAWGQQRQRLVDLVLAVANQNDEAMAPLEDKPQPKASERFRAALKDMASLRWMHPAAPKARSLDQALSLADSLYGLLLARRARIVATRQALESDLVDLTGHREQTAQNLIAAAGAEGRETSGVSLQVEDSLQAIQNLTGSLNGQVRDMNALINKLTLEAERAIVLASVLADEAALPAVATKADKGLLLHLRPLIELYENDMLSGIEIERRRGRVNALFQAAFDETGDTPTSRDPAASDINEAQNA